MTSDEQKSQEQAGSRDLNSQSLVEFVVGQMKAGAGKATIIQKLVEMGVEESDAAQLVQEIHAQVAAVVETQRLTGGAFVAGVAGGVVAAVVGGAVWGGIVIATNYEIGYMAWAMGLVCGFAVVLFSRGKRGLPLQVAAVLCSCLGILVGKYLTLFYYLREDVAEELGEQAASQISVISPAVMQFFVENVHLLLSGFDLLWVALAVLTAWRIPKGLGIASYR